MTMSMDLESMEVNTESLIEARMKVQRRREEQRRLYRNVFVPQMAKSIVGIMKHPRLMHRRKQILSLYEPLGPGHEQHDGTDEQVEDMLTDIILSKTGDSRDQE